MTRRRGGSRENATPFAELARWVRSGILAYLSPIARDTLFILTAHTNGSGEAWPSAEEIARLSRHKRDHIYPALREIERAGIFIRLKRFRHRGYNVYGPWVFRLCPFDENKTQTFMMRSIAWKTARRGDASRFGKRLAVPEPGTSRRDSDAPISETPATPPGVPLSEWSDAPECEVSVATLSENQVAPQCGDQDVPGSGAQKGIKGEREGVLGMGFGKGVQGETLLPIQDGGKRLSPQTPLSCSLSGNTKESKITAKEKQRAELVKFFRAEFSIGNGVKPFDAYLGWFPPQYEREDIELAYREAGGFVAGNVM